MKKKPAFWLFNVLILSILVLLSACASGAMEETVVPGQPPGAETTVFPTQPPAVEETVVPTRPPAADAARLALTQVLNLPVNQVTIASVEAVEWPDSCLGLGGPAEACAQVITPGYQVTLDVDGTGYTFRTDLQGVQIRLADAPAVQIDPLVEYRLSDPQTACLQVILGENLGAAGRCDSPMITAPLVAEIITRNLDHYISTYAHFEMDDSAGSIAFNGQGDQTASPAEQRMITEWVRTVAQVLETGQAGISPALALELHREGGLMGVCEDITIYTTGEVSISSCTADQPVELAHGRLVPGEVERLFEWMDSYQSFEVMDDSQVPADGLATRLVFTGSGEVAAAEEEQDAIMEYASRVYNRLTGAQAAAETILVNTPCEPFGEYGIWCLLTPENGAQEITPPVSDAQFYDYNPVTHQALYASHFPTQGGGPGNLSVTDMWIWDLSTGETRPLVESDQVVKARWSPEGSLAYIRTTPDTNELVWRTVTGEERVLAKDIATLFSISPDGQQVAFARESRYNLGGEPGLYVVSVEDGSEQRLSNADRAGEGSSDDRILWAPGAEWLIMPVGQNWLLAAANGSQAGFLTIDESLSGELWYNRQPNRILWHPDGEHLLASFETGGPGIPDPVGWSLVLLELDAPGQRLLSGVDVEPAGLLIGWHIPGESAWVLPIQEPGPMQIVPIDLP